MELNGLMGVLYRFAEWIMRLAYANLLWILFTLTGLVLFGFFPSTIGLFAVVRKWVRGEHDIPVFKTYWNTFRTEFVKGNILGFILSLIGCMIYIDLKFFQLQHGIPFLFLSYLFIALFFVYFLTLAYFFPVFVHYDLSMFQYIKQSFFIMISQPFGTIVMVAGMLVVYYIMLFIPGLIPFFAASLFAYVVTWIASRVFSRLENKIQHL
jgi:uncharacterized membrane protein YesL